MTRRQQSALANPVLIGAITVLVAVIAVFLAYIANSGLPFVPTQELKADLADGANVTIGNLVRSGGYQIGLVSDVHAVQQRGGSTVAELTLQISEKYRYIPVDSQVAVRPLSLLGLKYVDLVYGHSRKYIQDGGILPETHTRVPVQFDDVLKIFDDKTRVAIQQDEQGFGDALAGRGSYINDLIFHLPPLLTHLQSVAGYLANPSTGLVRFFDKLEQFMGTVAPVAQTNADVFRQMATTFAAITRDPNAYQQTIAKSPSTEAVSTRSLMVQQPFLDDSIQVSLALQPVARQLAEPAPNGVLPNLNQALEAGERVLPRTPQMDQEFQGLLTSLKAMAKAPGTNIALNALTSTVATLNPFFRYVAPFQTTCDYWNYWWTYLAEHQTAETQYGFAERVLLMFGDATQRDNVATANSAYPAGTFGGPELFHGQTYGAAVDNYGNADCETGQRGYPFKLNFLDPQNRQFATDNHTPGNQGPTFQSIRNGRYRVPAGETSSRAPTEAPPMPGSTNEAGVPQTPYIPTNP